MSQPARTAALLLALAALAALGACAGHGPVPIPGPVITEMRDDADIPPPRPHEFLRARHHIDNFGKRQLRLRLDPLPPPPALDVNAAGEVPNSTWFTNRAATVTPDDVRRGAGGDDPGPEAFRPWSVTGAKIGGRNPGLTFQDSRGRRYLLKFDRPGVPVVATAAGAVAARLFWALGYNTPDDRVVLFARDDLLVGPGVTVRDDFDTRRPLTRDDVLALLDRLPTATADGRHRGLASALLAGTPLGGFAYTGTRDDDPNDTIPHERRRVLRAVRVFGAWLQHIDVKEDNTLDMYVEHDGRRFIRHHLVDFDGCLGGFWAGRGDPRAGFTYDIDLGEAIANLGALGLRRPEYERQAPPAHPHVGLFEAVVFDPATWKPAYCNDYVESCDRDDARWAAGVLAHLTAAHLAAAVEAARFEDPAAAATLLDVLIARREKTLAWARALP